jgi:hypothetical protein
LQIDENRPRFGSSVGWPHSYTIATAGVTGIAETMSTSFVERRFPWAEDAIDPLIT